MIDNIIHLILPFLSKRTIISAALTNKLWYQSVPIDYDQESVAKNNDMFSLLKIPFSPKVVTYIALRNNHTNMVSYLLKEYNHCIEYDDEFARSCGYSGNKLFLDLTTNTANVIIGLCEGEHLDLFDKYINQNDISYLIQ